MAPVSIFRVLPPVAKRLNRNALTVGAVLAGMTVLTVLVLVRPAGEPSGGRAGNAAPEADVAGTPSRPSFLDEPAHLGPRLAASRGDTGRTGTGAPPAAAEPDRAPGVTPALGDAVEASVPSNAGIRRPSRERAYRAAVLSSAVLPAPTPTPISERAPDSAVRADAGTLANDERQLLDLGDSVLRAARHGLATGSAPFTAPSPSPASSAGRRHRAFLDAQGDTHGEAVSARLEPAGSPCTLRAGTLIPGFLVTGITSDLPGDVVGQVSRDVFDSREERLLLIPKGARLIGTYDNQITAGEGRLLVAWTRLIFPDGRSLKLPGLALKDAAGQTGAKDQVDTHWERMVGKALFLSAIGAGTQLAQPREPSLLASPSSGQIAAGALGQELSSVALEIVRRGLDAPPTITIRAGAPFNVFLNGDLVFERPYQAERRSPEWTATPP